LNTRQINSQVSYKKGLIYGLGAMFVGAFGWAIVAYILDYIFVFGAIVIGFIIAYALSTGTGDVNKNVFISTFLLTIISVFLGDFIYILLILILDYGVPFNIDLITLVAENFVRIEIEEGGVASFVFALIGASLAVVQLSKQKQQARSVKGQIIFTEKKPFIAWSPKYIVPVKLSSSYHTKELLQEQLNKFGFSLTNENKEYLHLTRTNKRPEIPLRGSKQRLMMILPLPIKEDLPLSLLYAKTPFFDTGDLWKTARDLKTHLESEG
jgi:hypothetical protein